jgi:hypothetical protein
MRGLAERLLAFGLATLTVAVLVYLTFSEYDRRNQVARSLYRMETHITNGPIFGAILCEHIYHMERSAGHLPAIDCPAVIRELLEKENLIKPDVKE